VSSLGFFLLYVADGIFQLKAERSIFKIDGALASCFMGSISTIE
jgi:hypothetical protein